MPGSCRAPSFWADKAPVREELFGPERLEQHAKSLASAQSVTTKPSRVPSLRRRLDANARLLLRSYRASAAELETGRRIVPAAEWLLDNYHLVEKQISEIRADLPANYYRQLPKLASGPFAGYPRVFGLAWAFIAHTDSHLDIGILRRFIAAYQQVQPLTIGELWAVAITLRIVLIENLRRLDDQITAGRTARADADQLANRLIVSGGARASLEEDIASRSPLPLSELFAAQLAKRLRDRDPLAMPALGWLEERLARQGATIDDAVAHAQQRQGASNVTVRNVITSLRLMADIDWQEWFESVSLVDARLRAGSGFAAMDFPTRDRYRSAIEQLARGSPCSELEIAERALAAGRAAGASRVDARERARVRDPGYHLIAEGRAALAQSVGFKPSLRVRLRSRQGVQSIAAYVGAIVGVTAILLGAAWALASGNGHAAGHSGILALWLAALLLPASELASALVNRLAAWRFGAVALPGLELADGVPGSLRTLVAVPTLLTGKADLLEQIERLEVHYLASGGGDIVLALLTDGMDADSEFPASDQDLLAVGADGIAALNRRHGPAPAGPRFMLLHRRRIFNAAEGVWMGWERKRGKLHELNRLLRGAADTSFMAAGGGSPEVPDGVRYVLTLDADTRLPRDAVSRLVGKMAHALNLPRFDAASKRIVGGHAILQPRITPALPMGREGSVYQRISSSPAGMDPYAMAVSDVYQDLFGEGSYTGKGIYDIDAFEAAMRGRVPDNTLLSHDLFEGVFARAGLATDVELVEQAPARYDVAAARQHRWTRGDWQLLPWMFGRQDGVHAIPAVGRWKMFDNLRRSLLAPSMLLALVCAWLLPAGAAPVAVLLVLACAVFPALLPLLSGWPRRPGSRLRRHDGALTADLRLAALQAGLSLAFLADQAWRMGDAVGRTLVRLLVTRRHLLEWTSTAQSGKRDHPDLAGFYRYMAPGAAAGLVLATGALVFAPVGAAMLVWPFALLWLAAPALALWSSKPPAIARRHELRPEDVRALRATARRTWRYFETYVTPADHMLPPDNFQEDPKPALARRTSPTNIGLYLLSAVAARDFGWTGTLDTVERLEATLATLRELPRHKGHFFNWYGTADLRVLDPPYVSSVDSGNLAGHLLTLANACEEWRDGVPSAAARAGMDDALQLALQALAALTGQPGAPSARLTMLMDDMAAQLQGPRSVEAIAPVLERLAEKAADAAHELWPARQDEAGDLAFWLNALARSAASHARDRRPEQTPEALAGRLQSLADTAREIALAMDFAFLLDPERRLLSIGYSLAEQRLDPSCYDLLASEARLASLFAIAKGDAPTRHWFRLGRAAVPIGGRAALISWSGSMFEYLMPSLVMRAPAGSLLEQTNRLVVQRQVAYGRSLGIPWGMSESAYNARDLEFTYQYANFGVPGLGLKRGLADDRVIAPYATGLAAMVDPAAACINYAHLAALGGLGRHGFYEAFDFTPARVPEGRVVAVVRSYMAHHQGMTIVALANVLLDGGMRARFHREPMIHASELLLQERMPRDVVAEHPRAEEVRASHEDSHTPTPTVRRMSSVQPGPAPVTHLLSNGRYSVMLTAAGGGYSRWRGLAVTRWREDATRDPWGSFVYLRDVRSSQTWSASPQPMADAARPGEVLFGEDRASFVRRDGSLATTLDVLVSGEDDCEVRRLALANSGWRAREVDVTSYAELALAAPSADEAHPAFSKLFVLTEYLPEFGALIASRRPRAPDEPPVWAAHFAVVEGEITAEPQYESDRARFLGRGRDAASASAIQDGLPLSNTAGCVLDPVFSLRQRVLIPPGGAASVAFWTVIAPSRPELLELIDRHHDRSAFDRAATLAWTQAQVQLRHLGMDSDEAADFQRLAAPIIYADRRMRALPELVRQGAAAQSGLWAYAVSGDLPIVLLRIGDIEDMGQVHQLLRAHEYWRMKQLAVDLVILNERASSYVQDLQIAIETAVRSSQSGPRFEAGLAQGAIHALRADLIGFEARGLLQSAARVELIASQGTIADRLARLAPTEAGSAVGPVLPALQRAPRDAAPRPTQPPPSEDLEFFNGLGGFATDGREYVVRLSAGQTTPQPWINVVANPGFGFQVSAEGSASTWCENSRENQLTPWSNDPVTDPSGEAFFVKDLESEVLWSPTAQPRRGAGDYEARHGWGYSRFAHEANGIALELLQYVPLEDPVKISRLTLRNLSGRTRRLSVTSYAEWVLGTSRGASAPFIVTAIDTASGAMLARRPWGVAFPGRVAFADLRGRQTAWTGDRTEFLGRHGGPGAPAALLGRQPLSGATGAGLDPCAALQCVVELAAGESVEVVALLGESASEEAARALVGRYRAADLDAVLADVAAYWEQTLGAVRVKTPDRAMDIMLNGWLLYQTIVCRLWARSAFYQASGAYGFRDQLQDGMALTFAQPEETRRHLLRAAGRQFVEGDVQHWWLPHSGQGVRTRISDDRVWLALAAATYVNATGDAAVLDEAAGFLDGPALRPGEHDAFFQPAAAGQSASLFEHCARGLDQCIALTGPHGLPLIGTGDWNDGMNRVGAGGQGESVWLGWLLVRTIALLAPLAPERDQARASRWRAHSETVRVAIEREAWDGAWYRRATFDDGTWLGTSGNDECRIDAIAQAWAVLSGAADAGRAAMAMDSLARHLIRPGEQLALLLAPPFDKTAQDPGYIKGYPPGLRENGGQYSHAAMWAILAFAGLGDGDRAAALFDLVNPINHARTPEAVARYRVEPYVVAADVYAVAPHVGRGGWTWYTGSAGWMYRAGVEGILGLRREGDWLRVSPCIPSAWPGFEARLQVGSTDCSIQVQRASLAQDRTALQAMLDGRAVRCESGSVSVPLDGGTHCLVLTV
nr:glucoamylase family protein [Pigmentiphaga humi]